MSEKRNADSAPRDGSQFVGWINDEPYVVSWDDGYSIHGLGGRWINQDGWTYWGIEMTHWSPIEQYP